MRKRTLTGLSFLLAIAIAFGLRLIGFPVRISEPLVVGMIAVPALLVPLTLLNKRLLAWRKAHGRDIEEEERYEDEATGIITLHPRT